MVDNKQEEGKEGVRRAREGMSEQGEGERDEGASGWEPKEGVTGGERKG